MNYPPPTRNHDRVIYREVSLGVDAFDRVRQWQRQHERTEGRRITNGEVPDRLIRSHTNPR